MSDKINEKNKNIIYKWWQETKWWLLHQSKYMLREIIETRMYKNENSDIRSKNKVLTVRSSRYMVFDKKSIPIVACNKSILMSDCNKHNVKIIEVYRVKTFRYILSNYLATKVRWSTIM